MGVYHLFAWRPGEHSEATVLRGHQRQRIALIVNELRCRQVSGAAILRRLNYDGGIARDWLGLNYLLDRDTAAGSTYLASKCQHFILVVDYRCAGHRRQTRNCVDSPLNRRG